MITVELETLQIFGDFRQEGRCEINGSDSFQVSAGKERELIEKSVHVILIFGCF